MIVLPGDKFDVLEAGITTELDAYPGLASPHIEAGFESYRLHYPRVYYRLMRQHMDHVVAR
jgi:hypothetical protein